MISCGATDGRRLRSSRVPTTSSELPEASRAYLQQVEDVIASLDSDGRRGLSHDAARTRLSLHGANELAHEATAIFAVESAFVDLLTNRWLSAAIAGSLALQLLVVHAAFLQRASGTTGLSGRDWLLCGSVASSVLWPQEVTKATSKACDDDN